MTSVRWRIAVCAAVAVLAWTTAAPAGDDLDAVRRRLRAEAGAPVEPADGRDLPLVSITPLPGDDHGKLSAELTGSRDAEAVLRRAAPRLRPGERIYVPRAVLSPRLADPRTEALRIGGDTPTLWRLVRRYLDTRDAGTAATVRNVQRLNGIVDPTRLARGARVLVPRSLLVRTPARPAQALRVSKRYRVRDVSGLSRTATADDFPRSLQRRLRRTGLWRRQLGARAVDLVVIHTTEHRGAPFPNVARYIQRNRLTNYLVGPDGTVYEVVPEAHRAHGCGESLWEGRYAVDFGAINVEIYADTAGAKPGAGIRPAQYDAVRALLADIRVRRPQIHEGRVVTHRMVSVSYRYGTRSRKGDPYLFSWARAGLPDNSQVIDQDVLLGRARLCTDGRYADRVTEGQAAAARYQGRL